MNPYIERLDKNINVYYIENLNCPLHIHSHAELFYVKSGNLSTSVGGKSYKMKAGDIAFISPMQVHGFKTEEGEENECITHIFSPQFISDLYTQLTKTQPKDPFIIDAIKDESVRFAYDKLMRIDWLDLELVKALLHLTIVSCFKMVEFIPVKDHIEDRLYKVIGYINEHFIEDISIDSIGAAIGISKFSLSRMFSEKIGMSLRTYINSLRFEKMKALFTTTDLTITEVCYECGFSNQRTFNRVCLNLYGKTPKEIRTELRGITQ